MTHIDRIYELSLLWKQAAAVFPYFDTNPINWDATYREYLSHAIDAADEREYALIVAEFLNRLGDGHTDLSFSKEILDENGYLPFSLTYLEDGWYVDAIEERGKELLLGRVERVNGRPFTELLSEVFRYAYHVGDYMYSSRLSRILPFFLERSGNVLHTTKGAYTFDLAGDEPILSRLPDPESHYPYRDISVGKVGMRMYDGGRLVIKLNDLLDSEAAGIIAETGEREHISGIILDMRQNIGGMTVYGANIARLFIPGQFGACSKRMRSIRGINLSSGSQYQRMNEQAIAKCVEDGLCVWEEVKKSLDTVSNRSYEEYTDFYGSPEDRAVFDQPCIILTSRNTMSAAEDMIAMFRTNGRAKIVGTPTHGSSGTPLLLRLSCGTARICSIGYRLLDGTEFIGRGIQPDIFSAPVADEVEAGHDRGLDEALDLLCSQ